LKPNCARRYLYTELGDPTFGQRALYVLGKFNDAKPSGEPSSIPDQILLMARLRHMVSELKVGCCPAPPFFFHMRHDERMQDGGQIISL